MLLYVSLFLLFPAIGQESVSLTQCREWAHENYPQIRQYGLIDQTEQYNLSNAGKSWLPQLAIQAKATYQSDVTKLPFDGDKISALIPGFEVPVVSKDQYQVVAELNQTIWDGGMISSARQLTKAEATVNREQLENDLYTINDRVNQLYFGCLLQDELISQNKLLQKELQINIDRITAMMHNGVANLSDRESLEVELLNAKQRETELKAGRTAYRQMLSVLTGRSLEGTVLLTPALPEQLLSTNINRPELRVLDAQSRLIETQNKQINANLMPRIGAFVQGGYGRPGLNMLEDSFNPFYIAGIRLSWNIGNLYTIKNDRRKIETSLRSVDIRRETFLFNTQLTLLQQQTEINKMKELILSDEEIIRLRGNIKKAAEAKLENGIIAVSDLIREINAEDMAKQVGTAHRIQHLMAIYNLLYTTNNE
ncbi:TolC family protein [Parabacteroides sp. OttesenSCG-928-G07]|nr:TolC family protein [Parabacteroides sp. OttesenSCG-928-G07]